MNTVNVGCPWTLPKLVTSLRRNNIALAEIDYLLITPITPAGPSKLWYNRHRYGTRWGQKFDEGER